MQLLDYYQSMDDIAEQQRKFARSKIKMKYFVKEILETRRKISPHSHRSHSQPPPINRELIGIIKHSTHSNSNRIQTLLKSKGFEGPTSSSPKGIPPLKPHFQNRFFSQQYSRQQLKFITSSQKQHSQRQKLKWKLKIHKINTKPFHDLNRGSLIYFQKSSPPKQDKEKGRYREILHPLCGLYQKQAQRTLKSRLKLGDPFVRQQQ